MATLEYVTSEGLSVAALRAADLHGALRLARVGAAREPLPGSARPPWSRPSPRSRRRTGESGVSGERGER